jgi:hypothetical protein
MAEEFTRPRFRGFSTDKCRAAMRALYDEVFVFSISAFPDKPFVTFDIRAICWNLKRKLDQVVDAVYIMKECRIIFR